uniref:Variant surface glycoprotein 1125.5571 n=1 Tax=Trypanosoma brucei TaxID=5691 RepID=A0A1J0RCN4_9TRYP|nr:variant surface glycoprotein 1125.5571 [Trypanosoma brucei]
MAPAGASIALLMLAAIALLPASPSAANDKVAADVTDACKEEGCLRGLRAAIAAKANCPKGQLSKLMAAKLRWDLLTLAASEATTQCMGLAVARYADQQIYAINQQVKAVEKTAQAATTEMEKQLTRLSILKEVMGLKIAELPSGHKRLSNNNIELKFRLTAGGAPLCNAVTDASKIKPGTTPDYDALEELRLTKPTQLLATFRTSTLTATASSDCCATDENSTTLGNVLDSCTLHGSSNPSVRQDGRASTPNSPTKITSAGTSDGCPPEPPEDTQEAPESTLA